MAPDVLPPIAPDAEASAAQALLDEAIQARRAVGWELFDATNVVRDLLAAHDGQAAAWAYVRTYGIQGRWIEADLRVQRLSAQVQRLCRAEDEDDHQERAA